MRSLFTLLTLLSTIGLSTIEAAKSQPATDLVLVPANSTPTDFVDPLILLNQRAPLRFSGSGLNSLDQIPTILGLSNQCQEIALKLNQFLADYHVLSIQSRKEDSPEDMASRAVHRRITQILEKLESTKNPCFEPVTRSYSLASLAYLEPRQDQALLRIGLYLSFKARSYFLNPKNKKQIHESFGHRLSPLTEKIREGFGCRFKEPGRNHKYAIYGTYSCTAAAIFVDPYLPPLNLGSAVAHEITHLMTEVLGSELIKDSQTGQLKYTFPFRDESELRQWMTFDEVMASTISGFLQRRLEARAGSISPGWVDPALESKVRQNGRKTYQLKLDNTLFKRKNGHLAKILANRVGPDTNVTDFMLHSGLLACGDETSRKQNSAHWNAIYDHVHGHTFGSTTLEEKSAPFLPFAKTPVFDDQEREQYWRESACIANVPILSLWKRSLPKSELEKLGPMAGLFQNLLGDRSANLTAAQILIEKLHLRMQTTAAVCRVIHNAVHSTRETLRNTNPTEIEKILRGTGAIGNATLSSLIRKAPLVGHINVCPAKPAGVPLGTEGVRTDEEGKPAGTEVVRTDEEGNPTGTEGVRTDLEAVQACDEDGL